MFTDEKFNEEKHKAKEFYIGVKEIRCPYLQQDVHFNSEGFEHLLVKSWNRGRSIKEQYVRLRLLPIVVEILKKCHTLQEYDERQLFVRQKINSRWEKLLKRVKYFVFVALLPNKGLRLKMIIKQIGDGIPFFWSVYPSWKVVEDDGGNKKKIFYSGNLEED